MKKIIIAATVALWVGVLSTSSIKQRGIKPVATFYLDPFSGKNDIGSAD